MVQVQPLHVFSSRDRLDHPDAQSRCFERVLLCRLEHTFDPQFPPNDPVNVSLAPLQSRPVL